MKVNKIVAQNFKSLYEETTLDFTNMSGLWKCSGKVGSGKTTIGELIIFCLYGSLKDKNVPDLISWGTGKCSTHIELESRGHEIVIDRVIKKQGQGQLDLYIDGEELEYTNKKTAQNILEDDYFDCSRTAIESLCIISFNNFKSIAQLSSGSNVTRKFIDDIFGFNIINKYSDICRSICSDKSINLGYNEIKLQGLISSKEDYINIIKKFRESDDGGDIGELNAKIDRLKEEYEPISKKQKEDYQILKKEVQDLRDTLNSIKTRGSICRNNLDVVKEGSCPTCSQSVPSTLIESMTNELKSQEDQYRATNSIYKRSLQKFEELNSNIKTMFNEYNDNISDIQKQIRKIEYQKKTSISNYEDLLSNVEKEIEILTKSNIEDKIVVNDWNFVFDKISKDLRPSLLTHYIPVLNSNIEYYIQALQQPYTITFDTMFNCVISVHNTDNIPISSLSTGQLKTVNTAIIFGILKTLLNSINFNISFLDELFSNMHDDLRETTCRMLKDNINIQVMFVITHAHIDDDLFDGEISAKNKTIDIEGNVVQSTEYKCES